MLLWILKMKRLTLIFLLALIVWFKRKTCRPYPGRFQSGHFPPAYLETVYPSVHFFDEAAQGWFDTPEGWRYFNEWVSLYGDLDGGITSLPTCLRWPNPRAHVWWNFTMPPSIRLDISMCGGRQILTGYRGSIFTLCATRCTGKGQLRWMALPASSQSPFTDTNANESSATNHAGF